MEDIQFTYSSVKPTRVAGMVTLTLLNADMVEVFYGVVKRETANKILSF